MSWCVAVSDVNVIFHDGWPILLLRKESAKVSVEGFCLSVVGPAPAVSGWDVSVFNNYFLRFTFQVPVFGCLWFLFRCWNSHSCSTSRGGDESQCYPRPSSTYRKTIVKMSNRSSSHIRSSWGSSWCSDTGSPDVSPVREKTVEHSFLYSSLSHDFKFSYRQKLQSQPPPPPPQQQQITCNSISSCCQYLITKYVHPVNMS